MADVSDYENMRTAPMDGTPIDVRFIDGGGEYPGFPIRWDREQKCWVNHSTGHPIAGRPSRWKAYYGQTHKAQTHRRVTMRHAGRA